MTPAQLADLIAYDPNTGLLTWKPRKSTRWNTRCAGKPALQSLSRGYLTGKTHGENYKAHRVAWAIFYGEWPTSQIDHINGDRSDNRIANLRVVSAAENARNMGVNRNNTSGHQGVSWFARDSKYWAKITVAGKVHHLGFFDDLSDAVAAREAACKRFGFHENHGKR